MDVLLELFVFSAKAFILVLLILLLVAGILMLFTKGREKLLGRVSIKSLNDKYIETKEFLLQTILSKKQLKSYLKKTKAAEKAKTPKENNLSKNIFVIDFDGDIKASAVAALREEVTAILGVATPHDEVLVRVESGGGMVHAYGLAAAQLERFRKNKIPLTVSVDKIAASGGYLMASVANQIIAAPFAIIGSIGVIVQLPNFNRLLKENHVDFEQLTAGSFKRTITLFGHNTKEGRDKLQEEINEIQELFKGLITTYRKEIDIDKVATGEHWLGKQALDLKLVDTIITSDDYLFSRSNTANLYEIKYQVKKSLGSRLASTVSLLKNNITAKDPLIRF